MGDGVKRFQQLLVFQCSLTFLRVLPSSIAGTVSSADEPLDNFAGRDEVSVLLPSGFSLLVFLVFFFFLATFITETLISDDDTLDDEDINDGDLVRRDEASVLLSSSISSLVFLLLCFWLSAAVQDL